MDPTTILLQKIKTELDTVDTTAAKKAVVVLTGGPFQRSYTWSINHCILDLEGRYRGFFT